jgi:hypothetical protein
MATLVKKNIGYNGRFIYTIHKKKDSYIYSINLPKEDGRVKSSVISFTRKEHAQMVAYNINEIEESYVLKWDSYFLIELMAKYNLNLLIFNKNNGLEFEAKLYESPEEPYFYIDTLESIYNK